MFLKFKNHSIPKFLNFKFAICNLQFLFLLLILNFSFLILNSFLAHAGTEPIRYGKKNVPEGLTTSQWGSIREGMDRAEYYFTRGKTGDTENGPASYRAPNRAHAWQTSFTDKGVEISPRSKGKENDGPSWKWGLALTGYGYSGNMRPVDSTPKLETDKNRLTYYWNGSITEWYVNDARGLEQGFTISSPPLDTKGKGGEGASLQLEMGLRGGLIPRLTDNGRTILFKDKKGATILRYGGLYAMDSTGRALPSRMELSTNDDSSSFTVSLIIDDTDAVYPVIIDPLLTSEVAKLTASDAAAIGYFGWSVSVSGDTVVVGAYGDDNGGGTDSGSAYIFERNQDGADIWGQVTKITALNPAIGDYFGNSVSISGDTVLVGAYGDSSYSGSAYIFERNQGGADIWGYVKKITASEAGGGYFGRSVSISGDTVLVGASREGTSHGSAYIFERNQGGVNNWGEVSRITAFDAEPYDYFGRSVSVSGDTIVVGAWADDNDGGIDSGSAYIFERNQDGADIWGYVKKITALNPASGDSFGLSVSVSGDTVVVGAYGNDDAGTDSGSAYIFERNQDGADIWGQVTKITAAPDAAAGDSFGLSVSVSGDTVVVGAYLDDDWGTDSGSAYIFERNQGGADIWGQVKKITASDDAAGNDQFGWSVSVSGNTVLVGAWLNDDGGNASGSAYTFVRSGDDWVQEQKPVASDAADYDRFGYSVSVSGDTVVVGAYVHGSYSGSAYIFERNQGGTADNWGEVKKITASNPANGDYFGFSVSISGDTVVVGARYGDSGVVGSGLAYIFERNQGGTADNWGEVTKIIDPDAFAGDLFGASVSVSGDTVVVGAPHDDYQYSNSGSAYIFERNQGGEDIWGEVKRINASDAYFGDSFGSSVSVSGDTVLVGAPGNDDGGSSSGSAYIFERNQGGAPDNWGEVKKITDPDAAAGDSFGESVSISGDTVVVGASGGDNVGETNSGSAYIFERNQGGTADNWGQVKKIIASDGAASDWFGISVSVSGDTVLVGAHGNDDVVSASGSAYIFTRNEGGLDNWGEVKKITALDAAQSDNFGYSVSVSGDTVLVGAYNDDDGGYTDSGSAYIFRLTDSTDTTPPTVTDATSTTNNGAYRAGDVIAITITFDEVVTVDTGQGTPTLLLETGTTDRTVSYSSGSGTATLTFSYTVQSGDTSSDLDYVGTDSLSLNGGTIQDAAGNDANLTLYSPGAAGSLSANKNIVIDTSAPSTPGTPTDAGTYTTSTTVTFNWTAASDSESGIASYNLQVGTTAGGNDILDTNVGNVLTYNAAGTNGQTLYARVQAVNGAGTAGSWSGNSDGITIDTSAPSTPGTPTDAGTYTTSTTVTFNWTAASDSESGIASYNLQVGTTAGGNDILDANVGNVLTYNAAGTNGQTLYARVQAVNGVGTAGSWSGSSDGITIDTSAPSTPGTPTDAGTYTTSTTVTFNWTAAADGESGIASYNLQVGTTAGGNDVLDSNVGNVLTYNAVGTNGQTLYARVQAVNGVGTAGSWSGSSDGITISGTVDFIKIEPFNMFFAAIDGTQSIKVIATNNDGSREDVTASAAFSSSKEMVATVSTGGTVTAKAVGTAEITATYNTKTAKTFVTVSTTDIAVNFPVAELSGIPLAKVTSDSSTSNITVSGTDVIFYRYSFDGASYSDEIAVGTKITDVLTPGAHTLSVVGKNSSGIWQPLREATRASWLQEADIALSNPTISVSPMILDFGNTELKMEISVSNIGSGTANWSMTTDESWISIRNGSGGTTDEIDIVQITVNRSGQSAGLQTGSILMNTDAGGAITIAVTMTVDSEPVLRINPLDIDLGTLQEKKKLYITNEGGGTLNWTASLDSNTLWLSIDVSIGAVNAGETGMIILTIDRTQMTGTGKNTGAIAFTDENGNAVQVNVVAYKPDAAVSVKSIATDPSNMDADGTKTSTVTVEFNNCADQIVTFFTDLGYFSGSSSTTVISGDMGIAAATYTASLVAGISTIKAVCRGVTAASTINLNTISFTNAETEILNVGAGSMDKKLTTGLSMDKVGFGTPSVTLAVYSSNPGETVAFNLISNFFDAHLDNTEDIDTLTIKNWVTAGDIAGTDTNDLVLYYADGTTWKRCSDTGFTADTSDASYVGYIYAIFTESTTPTIEYLDGLPLVGGIIPGIITGTVSSTSDNSPIEGAILTTDLGGCDISQANGVYVFSAPAGTNITVFSSCTIPDSCTIINATPCSGYLDASVSGVSVSSGGTAVVNISMSKDTEPPVTTASIPGGKYNSAQSVTLTCVDGGGSGCAATYYTTNGSTPTINSDTSALDTISESTILKFFSTDNAGNMEKFHSVEFFILPAGTPALSTSSDTLDFDTSKSDMYLDISNTGGGQMEWTMSSDQSWLTVKNPSGMTQAGGNRVEIHADRSGLSSGIYIGTITIDVDSIAPKTITVTITVSDSPVLSYSPAQIQFGSSSNKAALNISNVGKGTLNWSVSSDVSWLTFDTPTGETATDTNTVTMTIDRSGMDIGENTGTLTLLDGSNTFQLPVTAHKPDPNVAFSSMTTDPSNMDADGRSISLITATFSGSGCASQTVTFSTELGYVGGSSSTTSTSENGVATTTYTASSVKGIAVIKAECNGVFGAGTVNLNNISFTNAETEIPGTGAATIDKRVTTGLSMEKSGFGTPPVTLATYSFNPGNTFSNVPVGNYFDANLGDTDDVDSITIKKWVTSDDISYIDELGKEILGLYYANGTSWEACSNTGYVSSPSGSYVGYIYATFTDSTTPSIDYLDGLPLVAGEGAAVPIPTLSEWAMVALFILLLISGIFIMVNRRKRAV